MKQSLMLATAFAGLAILAAPAFAQTPPPAPPTASHRALAAGYKALTLCSAMFTAREARANRTQASVAAHEFVGIYPELQPLIADLPVETFETEIAVAWDEVAPPRVAQFTPGRGCMIMPTGFVGGMREIKPVPRRASAPPLPTGTATGDAAALEAVVGQAFAGDFGTGAVTTGVVILQDGRIVAERYAPDFGPDIPQRTWSVAKSLAGTVIGAAVQRGEVDPDAPAAIANWQATEDPRRAITLDALMRMSSGLTSDTAGNRTDALYFGGTAVDEQASGWPLIAPVGTRFRYANNDSLLAVMAIAPTFEAHPPHALFDRLGMTHTWAETDWRGNYMMSSQVWTTARDLARFGQLYIQDGVWDGERVLPEGWRARVTTPSGPQPPTGTFGYGATFWLMNREEGVPADAFSANGNRGQYVVIVPSRNVVIVRRGEDPAGQGFNVAAFTRDVLAALN
ncbi:serine hydrolase [Brevundimonas sp. NIBR10]|uniref:serine hydrolase domain-containing protein n=1 Tax=Brevundimonas sp. NIBR10 TaxID=3015997 RepID=UPI0022F1D620|nr:serine hydrolase [Brevundimonas sp. NIBR10]